LTAEASAAEEAGSYGQVFTRRWVVDLICDLAGYTPDRDLARFLAIEPACGSGAFVAAMVDRLVASCAQHGRDIAEAADAIRAFDLIPENVGACRNAVVARLRAAGVQSSVAAVLAMLWVSQADYLISVAEPDAADFVIGNPPYVRLEDVSMRRQRAYRAAWPTMGGRADLFVGFFEAALRSLKAGGTSAFICADRWMRNAYGRDLRSLVAEQYAVDTVLVAHDVDAFEQSVSAYPAITVIRRAEQRGAIIADTTSAFGPDQARRFAHWSAARRPASLRADGIRAARLPTWFSGDRSWPTGTPEQLAVVADVERRLPPLEDRGTGTRIGIGVASGADGVFVTKDKRLAEPSRLMPLAMAADTRSGRFSWSGHYLLSPWDKQGLVNLEDYPKLRHHFEQHAGALAKRHVAQRQPCWYRTIDRVTPGLAYSPKLLFADLGSRIRPVLEQGGHYPHHNLYWVTSSQWDLRVLGGLLLSDIANLFISAYCVRMRGGTLRFQAQYLRRVRVPRLADIDARDRRTLADAFDAKDAAAATAVALRLYGLESVPA
jgi:hypothetical protein